MASDLFHLVNMLHLLASNYLHGCFFLPQDLEILTTLCYHQIYYLLVTVYLKSKKKELSHKEEQFDTAFSRERERVDSINQEYSLIEYREKG